MRPTGPPWTREGCGISTLTGEWPSSCRGPIPTRVTRGRGWETAWDSCPGNVLGPGCPSNSQQDTQLPQTLSPTLSAMATENKAK